MLPSMARLDLTEDEREELLRLLRQTIDDDRFPLSPRKASAADTGRLAVPRTLAAGRADQRETAAALINGERRCGSADL